MEIEFGKLEIGHFFFVKRCNHCWAYKDEKCVAKHNCNKEGMFNTIRDSVKIAPMVTSDGKVVNCVTTDLDDGDAGFEFWNILDDEIVYDSGVTDRDCRH